MIRAFIGIPLSEGMQERINKENRRIKRLVGGIKIVDSQNLHITLNFLGNVEYEDLMLAGDEICERVSKVKEFHLRIKNLGAFSSFDRARVLWWGVSEGGKELIEVWKITTDVLKHHGFSLDEKPFHPHITIGRFKGRPVHLNTKDLPMSMDFGIEKIGHLCIFKSTLTPQGPIYEVLKECFFNG